MLNLSRTPPQAAEPATGSRLAIPPRADASASASSSNASGMPNSSSSSRSGGCVSLAAMRAELQRGAELAAAAELDARRLLQQRQSKRMMGRPAASSTGKDRARLRRWSGENPALDDDDEDELQQQMRRLRVSGAGGFEDCAGDDADDVDDSCYLVDTPELAAFLGMATSTAAIAVQQQQQLAPSIVKAASFSGGYHSSSSSQQQRLPPLQQRGVMVPCSPPVPIPQKQLLQRRNSVTGSLLSTSRQNRGCDASLLVDASGVEHAYSRTQCEARLWDEDWHFKLSLEARESFERSASRSSLSTNDGSGACSPSSSQRRPPRRRSEGSTGVWKPQSTASLTSSAADTTRADESGDSDFGDDGDCSDVFDMDDL